MLVCPICHKRLTVINSDYHCRKCGKVGYMKNELIHLHKNDSSWFKCEKEKQGWISISKELGLYFNNNDHFYIPDGNDNVRDFYAEAKKSINKFIELEDLRNKKCVDFGAGIGWVECYILKHVDTDITAIECNDDENVGLGRSTKLKEFHKCNFNSVVSDMHDVPIKSKSVDVVFMVDALHHFTDLNKVLSEAYRILKPHGHFWAINEPFRPAEFKDEFEFIKNNTPLENKHGIIERRPTISEYLEAGKSLRLRVLNEEIKFKSDGLILFGQKPQSKFFIHKKS